MDAYVEVGDFKKTWALFTEMKETNLVPDSYTYATLIKGLKVCGLKDGVEKAISILELIKSGACLEIKPDEVLYNSVLDICIKNSEIEKAEKIFNEMKASKIQPSIITYSIMIRGFGIIFDIEKAFAIYEEMLGKGMKPNDITYGCLMNCAVRCNNLELMLEIYERMKTLKLKPNVIIHTTLIKGFNKMKQYEKAFTIFDEIPDEEKESTNIVIYNAILDVCVNSGNFEKLKSTYDYIKNKALTDDNFPQPNLITFSTVIKGYIKSKNVDEIEKIYDFLKTNNFKLDEIFFSIMIDGLASFNLIEKAEKVFEEMNHFKVQKSSVIYSNMIKMYSKIQAETDDSLNMEKAKNLFNDMKQNKIKPSIISYTSLIQMYIRRKRLNEAINVFRSIAEEGLEIDYVAYNFIINGCTFNKNLENAIIFLLEALEKKVRLSKETYKNVLTYLLNNKFMRVADRKTAASKILTEMKNQNIEIDYQLYSQLMRLVYNKDSNSYQMEFNNGPRKYNFNSNQDANGNSGNRNFGEKKQFVKKDNNNFTQNKKNQFSNFTSLYD